MIPFETTLNQDMKAVTPKRSVDPRWLAWGLRTYKREILQSCRKAGTTVASMDTKRLLAFELPIPPVDEQRRIVDILEGHFSHLDAANELLESTAVRATAWRTSFVDELVWRSRWDEVPIGSLLSEPLRNGHSARASVDGTGVRTLTLTAVTLGRFEPKYTKMTIADPNRVAGLWLRPGDILVERSNTAELVGTTAFYDGNAGWAIFPDLVIRARIDASRARPQYVSAAMASGRAHRWLRRQAKGLAGSMPKVDQGTISALTIPLPSLDDQDAVLTRLAEAMTASSRTAMSVANARRRADALRRALLQAAFSGRLSGHSSDLEQLAEAVG